MAEGHARRWPTPTRTPDGKEAANGKAPAEVKKAADAKETTVLGMAGQVATIASSFALLLSATYEAGFFAGVGGRILSVPVTVSDILVQALAWLPQTIALGASWVVLFSMVVPELSRAFELSTRLGGVGIIVLLVFSLIFSGSLLFVFDLYYGPLKAIYYFWLFYVAILSTFVGIQQWSGLTKVSAIGLLALPILYSVGEETGKGAASVEGTDRIILEGEEAALSGIVVLRSYASGVLCLRSRTELFFVERRLVRMTVTSANPKEPARVWRFPWSKSLSPQVPQRAADPSP